MATQNFLSGGYYGKLGATVGQRWKNKRTIRTYVIPHDPKTPDQIAQRTKFGSGVFYAQLAQQANYSCTFFNSESMTNWNRRMSVAVENKSLFTTLLSLIPLIPNNSVAPYTITSGTYKVDNDTHTMEIKLDGHLPSAARKYTVLLTNNPTGTTAADVKMLSATSTAANPNVLTTSELADFEMLDTTKVRIVSSDDVNSLLDMVISAEITLARTGLIPVPLDLAVSSVSQTAGTTVITFADDYVSGDTTINIGAIVADLNGKIISLSEYTKSIINNGGKLALQIVQTDYAPENQIAWGTSGSITIKNLYIDTEEYHCYAENVTRTITQSGTITRSYASTISNAQIVNNVFSFVQSASQIALFDNPTEISVPTAYNTFDVGNKNWSVSDVASPAATSRKYTLETPGFTAPAPTVCYVSMGTLSSDISIPERTKIIDGVTYKLTGSSISNVAGSYSFAHDTVFYTIVNSDLFFANFINLYVPVDYYDDKPQTLFYSDNATGIDGYTGKNGKSMSVYFKNWGRYLALVSSDSQEHNPAQINCFFDFDGYTLTGGKSTLVLNKKLKDWWYNKYNTLKSAALFESSLCKNSGMTGSVLTTPLIYEFKNLALSNKDGAFTAQIAETAGADYDVLKNATVYVLGAQNKDIKQNSSSLECVIDTNNSNLKVKASFATETINYQANGKPVTSYIDLNTGADKTKSYINVATIKQGNRELKICTDRFTLGWSVDNFANTVATSWTLAELAKERLNPVALDLSVSSVSTSGDTTTIVFANNYVTGKTTLTGVSATAELNGKTVTPVFSSVKLANANGKLALKLVQSDYAPENQIAFGSTGSITVGSLYIDTATTHYYAINTTKSCTESGTITRSYASTISNAQIVNNVFSFVQSASQIALFDNPTEISVPTAYNTFDVGNKNWSVSDVASPAATSRKYTLETPGFTAPAPTVCYVSMGTLSSDISIPERTKIIDGVTYKLTGSSISNVAGSYSFAHDTVFYTIVNSDLFFANFINLYVPVDYYDDKPQTLFYSDNATGIDGYTGKNGKSMSVYFKNWGRYLALVSSDSQEHNPAQINCFFDFDGYTLTGGKSTLVLNKKLKDWWYNKYNVQLTQALTENVNIDFTSYTIKSVTTPAYISFEDYVLNDTDKSFTVVPNTTVSSQFDKLNGLSLTVTDTNENELNSNSVEITEDRKYNKGHLNFKATFNPAILSWANFDEVGGGTISLYMENDTSKPYSCIAIAKQGNRELKICTPTKTEAWINEDFGVNQQISYGLTRI